MPHSFVCNRVHCIFSTKGREKSIRPEIQYRLWAFLGGIAREHGATPLCIGGVEDHVHLLLSIPGTASLSKTIQAIKAISSKWLNAEFRPRVRFAWQEGFAGFSVGLSQIEATRRYIANQKARHRRRSFEEELLAILRKHGVEFDPKYVFG